MSVAGTFGDALGFELLKRLLYKAVRQRVFHAERCTLGGILDIDVFQHFIHYLRELFCLRLCGLLVGKLVVEMVSGEFHIGETDKELGQHARLLLRLVDSLNKLTLMQFLARHGDNAVHLLNHVDGRRIAERVAHLDKVVHIVAVEPRESGYVGAVTLALFELPELQEMLVLALQFVLGNELVVVEMREEDGVECVVQHQSETALRSEIAELLMEHRLWERVLEFLDIDFSVAALPSVEDLQVRPVVLGEHGAVFCFQGAQFVGTLGVGLQVGLNVVAYPLRDIERGFQCALFDVVAVVLEILVDVVLHLDHGGRVGGCDDL